MRILLIQPRPRPGLGFRSLSVVEPLGLEYIAALLPYDEVQILDLFEEGDLVATLRSFRPQVCGLHCSFTMDVNKVRRLAFAIKETVPEAFVVVGGHHPSLNPQDFQYPFFDAVVLGEAEETFPQLIQCLKSGASLDKVAGLALNDHKGQRQTPPRPLLKDLDACPFPERKLTQKWRHRYFLSMQKGVALVETARGCPYRCHFCAVWHFYRGGVRRKSPERVVKEVARTEEKHIFFTDDNFFLDVPRAMEIAALLKEAGLKRSFYLQARSDTVADHNELVSLWAQVGLAGIFLGLEAITDEGLAAINKRNSVAKNEQALEVLRRHGVMATGNFLVGCDFSRREIEMLCNYAREIPLFNPTFTILTPLPGTSLYEECKDKLTTQNYDLYDLFHAVLPTTIGLREFYKEFAQTYRACYPLRRLGISGLAAALSLLVKDRKSLFHRLKILSVRKYFMDIKSYLAGHEVDAFLTGPKALAQKEDGIA